jgi:hypothetical protein
MPFHRTYLDRDKGIAYTFYPHTKEVIAIDSDTEEYREMDSPSLRERLAKQGVPVDALMAPAPRRRN